MASPSETLTERDFHIWITRPNQIADPALLNAFDSLLSEDERQRRQRLRFDSGRHDFLCSRALVRTVLSKYAAVDPANWRFVLESHGRPKIAPELAGRLRFNLSHTDGLIACAVTLDREIGVDVEATDRRVKPAEIADRFFSPSEVEELFALPAHRQRIRFFAYWTLKESYIKARGLGLVIPLEKFSFHLNEGRPIEISIDPSLADDPESWQFYQYWPTDKHCLAACVYRTGEDLAPTVRECVPLID